MTIQKALLIAGLIAAGCATPSPETKATAPKVVDSGALEVVLASEVEWEQLNPARGDKSPQAATLWGDRKGAVPTGFLVKFVEGFSSPPHIHNATYRAVVLEGAIHNDDPGAAPMWMPPGSFWTQPKGEVHITSANAETNVALVEIDVGPYLVMPTEDTFDSGERPINMDPTNMVWVDVPGPSTTPLAKAPMVAYLWGDLKGGASNGRFLKLPPGYSGTLHTLGTTFRAVVIEGELKHSGAGDNALDPGSYFGAPGESWHRISSNTEGDSILYIRTDGDLELKPTPM